ncbi:hypothetical protein OHV05_25545 [Kitasatospora sp. NBC_00070]|uniref:hypothetical protein n=1 Tax=Kitasatospora sp. NBC_00070 TaxID=2975962 RepID=UPI00324AFBC6
MPHDPQSDHELHDALGLAVRGFSPHSPDLVQRAAGRGRHLRRVRQAQLAFAAVLLTGTAGLGLSQFGPQTGPAPAPPATSPTVSPSPAPRSHLSPAPSYQPTAAARKGPVSRQLLALLPARLTATSTVGTSQGEFTDGRVAEPATGSRPQEGMSRSANGVVRLFGDEQEGSHVQISIADLASPELRTKECKSDQDECATLADGTLVFTQQATDPGQARWSVTTLRPDGRWVTVVQYDYSDRSRAERTLTLDELTAIAASPHWSR